MGKVIDQKCRQCGALKTKTEIGAWRTVMGAGPEDTWAWQHGCEGLQGTWMEAYPVVVGANVYIASSWRNPDYENLRDACRWAGYSVYDWKNADGAFNWKNDLDMKFVPDEKGALGVVFSDLRRACADKRVKEALRSDVDEAARAQVIVLLLPTGRNAHFEFGVGKGIRMGPPVVRPALIVSVNRDRVVEPETIYAGADAMCIGLEETMQAIARFCP